MKTNTFYGEYSLDYWIKLLKSKNIEIPKFQRKFKWKKHQVQRLIESIKNKKYIPTVTIARANGKNYILDGQQRLLSILLAYANKYPKNASWKYNASEFESDPQLEDTNFLDNTNKSDFLKNHFLGFVFITIDSNVEEREQQQFIAEIFYSINTLGLQLKGDEKFEAYNTIYPELEHILKPKFKDYFRINKSKNHNHQLIRILGYAIQYHKNKSIITAENIEDFSNTVESIITKSPTELFDKTRNPIENINYGEIFSQQNNHELFLSFDDKFDSLLTALKRELNSETKTKTKTETETPFTGHTFTSIAHFDLFFFGLIYHYLFSNVEKLYSLKKADTLKKLIERINNELENGNQDKDIAINSNTPNDKKYLIGRMKCSIEIYNGLMKDIEAEAQPQSLK